jgi:hypothetical protein
MQNPLPALQSFIFGAGTDTPTYESLKKKREIADLLAQQAMGGEYRNWGDGVGGLMKALGARMVDNKISGQEADEGQRAASEVAKILAGMGQEGISVDQFTGLAGATENPYLPPEQEAIARAMMRRKVSEPTGTPFAPGGGIGDRMAMSSMNAPLQPSEPTREGPMGWVDPGEVPPEPEDEQGWMMPNGPMSGAGTQLAARGKPSGPMVAQADTGNMTDASVRGDVKLTEQQSKDLGYWNRMDAVTPDIDAHTGDLTALGEKMKDGIPLVGNMMVSEGYQVGRRAANEWIVALLRKDTGAQVTKEEWALYGPIYIPQPGDGEPVLKAKAEARKRAAEGMKAGLGIAEVLANELLAARQTPAAPAGAGADDWRTKDPSTWTDEQLREFTQ